jgi:ligand-binding sensor domain-containing protein
LWVGTTDSLALLDRYAGTFTHYRHDANDSASLRDSFVMSLYQDPPGLVWVGTRTGGVSRWNPRSWQMGGLRPAWLENQPITAFADAPDNQLWIASLAGLVRFDVDAGTATPIDALVGRHVAIVANLKPAKLMGIESNGMVLAASPDGGKPLLVSFDTPPAHGTRVR